MRPFVATLGGSIAVGAQRDTSARVAARSLLHCLRRCLPGGRRPLRRNEPETRFSFGAAAPSHRCCGRR